METISVCEDCAMVLINGDYSGIEYAFTNPSESEKRIKEVQVGVTNMPPVVYNGDHDEFSWSPCECCGSTLGGKRFHMMEV